jgi:hypothetical protein
MQLQRVMREFTATSRLPLLVTLMIMRCLLMLWPVIARASLPLLRRLRTVRMRTKTTWMRIFLVLAAKGGEN